MRSVAKWLTAFVMCVSLILLFAYCVYPTREHYFSSGELQYKEDRISGAVYFFDFDSSTWVKQ